MNEAKLIQTDIQISPFFNRS